MATRNAARRLSDEQLQEFFALLKRVDSAELKLSIPESGVRSTAAALNIDPLDAQIRQVIWNLASNALRAMPGGGVLGMTVSADDEDTDNAHLTIAVRDEGVGSLAWHRDRYRSPAARAFVDLAAEVCARVESDLMGETAAAA